MAAQEFNMGGIGPELAEGKVCKILVGENPNDLHEKLKSFYKSGLYDGLPIVTKIGTDEDLCLMIHYTSKHRYQSEGLTENHSEVTFRLEGKLKTIIKELIMAAEPKIIIWALKKTQGVKYDAAALLGISRPTLDSKIEQYEINVNEFK